MSRGPRRGFTIVEVLLALFLVGLVTGMIAVLFQRSFQIMRLIDDKERARQASRMGLDRITSELREATEILQTGADILSFEKIDPTAVLQAPPTPPEPDDSLDGFALEEWGPNDYYPATTRLIITYAIDGENLTRRVQRKAGGGGETQVVVVGVNSFTTEANAQNAAEIDVTLSVRDNRKVTAISSRILAPCIVEEHG